MFNDKVTMGFVDVYDQYILNLLYHPRIKPRMTVDEVKMRDSHSSYTDCRV